MSCNLRQQRLARIRIVLADRTEPAATPALDHKSRGPNPRKGLYQRARIAAEGEATA